MWDVRKRENQSSQKLVQLFLFQDIKIKKEMQPASQVVGALRF